MIEQDGFCVNLRNKVIYKELTKTLCTFFCNHHNQIGIPKRAGYTRVCPFGIRIQFSNKQPL